MILKALYSERSKIEVETPKLGVEGGFETTGQAGLESIV